MPHPFAIEFLDHVAIRVKDLNVSQNWYQDYLGFKALKFDNWGDYPIFMVSGNFGVALFPANLKDPEIPESRNIKIDHFAFRVSKIDFKAAVNYFQAKGIPFLHQDHHYFESIYLNDPDGHEVELTSATEFIK
jgi:catechol 2,3-dioxygenase-like lactoylglutathione lyase family enzyme